MVITKVMEDAGVPVSNGLGIAIHLVNMFPSIPTDLAFHAMVHMLTGFVPEVYASKPWLKTNILDLMHTPPPHSDHMAMDVLHDEIIHNFGGVPRVATVHLLTASVAVPSEDDCLGGQKGEVGARDGTAKSPLHFSPTQHSPGRHSQTQSPSP